MQGKLLKGLSSCLTLLTHPAGTSFDFYRTDANQSVPNTWKIFFVGFLARLFNTKCTVVSWEP